MSEIIDAPLAFMYYTDATYDYYCEAPPRTALTDPQWQVSRINKTTLQEQWAADANGNLKKNLATNLGVVAALNFA